MRLLQYGQWDAYPSGNGLITLGFVRSLVGDGLEAKLRERLLGLRDVTEEDVVALYEKAGVQRSGNGWITYSEGQKLDAIAPELSRDTCAGIYPMVLSGDATVIRRDMGFSRDGLFCEWSYVVDLDSRTLRVYSGAWSGEPYTNEGEDGGLVEFFDFDHLPSDEEFLGALDPDEED